MSGEGATSAVMTGWVELVGTMMFGRPAQKAGFFCTPSRILIDRSSRLFLVSRFELQLELLELELVHHKVGAERMERRSLGRVGREERFHAQGRSAHRSTSGTSGKTSQLPVGGGGA